MLPGIESGLSEISSLSVIYSVIQPHGLDLWNFLSQSQCEC